MWFYDDEFTSEEREKMLVVTMDGGDFTNSKLIDSGTFQETLDAMRFLGPEQLEETREMAPVGHTIFNGIFDKETRTCYLNELPLRDPVKVITDKIKPYGLVSEAMETLSCRLRVPIQRIGKGIPLTLPIENTVHYSRLFEKDQDRVIYAFVAPSPEGLLGDDVGIHGCTEYKTLPGPEVVTRKRHIKDVVGEALTVLDQAHLLGFYVAKASQTAEGVLDDIQERCLSFTQCHGIAEIPCVYRSVAVIKLAEVHKVKAKSITNPASREIDYKLSDINFKPDRYWSLRTFQYSNKPGKEKYFNIDEVYDHLLLHDDTINDLFRGVLMDYDNPELSDTLKSLPLVSEISLVPNPPPSGISTSEQSDSNQTPSGSLRSEEGDGDYKYTLVNSGEKEFSLQLPSYEERNNPGKARRYAKKKKKAESTRSLLEDV